MKLQERLSLVFEQIGADIKAINNTRWSLLGNAGTNPANHFIGTADNQPLVFRTNNNEQIRILANGNVGIGSSNPQNRLDIVGGMSLRNVAAANGSNFGMEFNTNSNSPRIDWVYNGNYTGSFAGDADFFFRLQNSRVGQGGFRFMTNQSGTAVERLTIHNNGNIGINTTIDAGFRLNVNGSGSFVSANNLVSHTALRVRNSLNNGDLLNVRGNGSVLIGVGGLSISRSDDASNSLLATITHSPDGTTRFSTGITSSRYGTQITSESYIEHSFSNGRWQFWGAGTGTTPVFLLRVSNLANNTTFFRLQNVSNDLFSVNTNGNVLIGTTTDIATAILNLTSTTKGFLPPRMTTTQRDAIENPPTGLVLFNTTTDTLQVRASTGWINL